MFMWVVSSWKILTLDGLIRRGFTRPSMCMLCKVEKESLDHFLGYCRAVNYLWDKGVELFKQSERVRNDTPRTIEEWGKYIFTNPILNSA
jgi:hypothetical protein